MVALADGIEGYLAGTGLQWIALENPLMRQMPCAALHKLAGIVDRCASVLFAASTRRGVGAGALSGTTAVSVLVNNQQLTLDRAYPGAVQCWILVAP